MILLLLLIFSINGKKNKNDNQLTEINNTYQEQEFMKKIKIIQKLQKTQKKLLQDISSLITTRNRIQLYGNLEFTIFVPEGCGESDIVNGTLKLNKNNFAEFTTETPAQITFVTNVASRTMKLGKIVYNKPKEFMEEENDITTNIQYCILSKNAKECEKYEKFDENGIKIGKRNNLNRFYIKIISTTKSIFVPGVYTIVIPLVCS